jgi:hypothetical protein
VRAALRPIDPALPLTEVRAMQDIVDESVSPRRVIVTLLAGFGLSVGLLASWSLARVIRGLLFGVTFGDPVTFAGTLGTLALVAALAGYLPARRASRQNPAAVLRAD